MLYICICIYIYYVHSGGCSVGLYSGMKSLVSNCSKGDSKKETLSEKYLAGALSASLGQFLASPIDLVKIRQQTSTAVWSPATTTKQKSIPLSVPLHGARQLSNSSIKSIPKTNGSITNCAIHRHNLYHPQSAHRTMYTGSALKLYSTRSSNSKHPAITLRLNLKTITAHDRVNMKTECQSRKSTYHQNAGKYKYRSKRPVNSIIKSRVQSVHASSNWWHCMKHIYRNESGVRGLMKGCLPNIQKAAVVNGAWISSYDISKNAIKNNSYYPLPDGFLLCTIASQCAGLACCLTGNPFDVIKTRMMAASNQHQEYKSSLTCLIQTVKGEGMFSLYKGFGYSLVRTGPWSATFFLIYEQMSSLVLGPGAGI